MSLYPLGTLSTWLTVWLLALATVRTAVYTAVVIVAIRTCDQDRQAHLRQVLLLVRPQAVIPRSHPGLSPGHATPSDAGHRRDSGPA